MKPEILEELNLASELEDARAAEEAIEKAYYAGFDAELVPVLLDLLEQNFHTRHEDIISTLQELKDPRPVDVLYRASLVSHSYLDCDENFGLARKCTWALADIGTPEARSTLETLAKNPNPLIAGYAQKRIDQWENELSRKGTAKPSA